MSKYDFAICKACGQRTGEPRFKIQSNTTIRICSSCGFHYIDALDDDQSIREWTDRTDDAETRNRSLELELESNKERMSNQIALTKALTTLPGARCLDIGAGTGAYLDQLRGLDLDVTGLEPCADMRRCAKDRFGLDLHDALAEDISEVLKDAARFDLITLWDVVEHLNFPHKVISAAAALLRPNGHLIVATPIRDTLYYEGSSLLYRVSRGRRSGWLDMLYSPDPFGHKQIFHSDELMECGRQSGLSPVLKKRVRELAAPKSYYVDQIVPPGSIWRPAAPIVSSLLDTVQFANKIWIAWQKPASP